MPLLELNKLAVELLQKANGESGVVPTAARYALCSI